MNHIAGDPVCGELLVREKVAAAGIPVKSSEEVIPWPYE